MLLEYEFEHTIQVRRAQCCYTMFYHYTTAFYCRCFEVNGVVGVNFVARPCMFLHSIKSLLEEEEAD